MKVIRTLDPALTATATGWSYEPSYIVIGTTNERDVLTAVDDATGLAVPQLDDRWEGLVCVEVNPSARLGGDSWRVETKYESRTVDVTLFDRPPKPKWQWIPITVNKPRSTDVNNKPLLNSAGDPLIGDFDYEENAVTLRVRLQQPFYDPAVSMTYRKRINSAAMLLFGTWSVGVGNLKCTELRTVGEQQADDDSVEVEYEFEIRDGYRPFDLHATDKGFNGWWNDGSTTRYGAFYPSRPSGGASEPVSDAVLLDGTGKPISSKFVVQEADDTEQQTPVSPGAAETPDNFEIHPDSTAAAKTLIFDGALTADFRGFLPGVM